MNDVCTHLDQILITDFARAGRRLELVLRRPGGVPRRRDPRQHAHPALTNVAVMDNPKEAPRKRIGFLSFGAWHPDGGLTHTGADALQTVVWTSQHLENVWRLEAHLGRRANRGR
jgi:hypothetical protein